MEESKSLNVCIQPELKSKAKALAEQDGRSLSNWIKNLIKAEISRADGIGQEGICRERVTRYVEPPADGPGDTEVPGRESAA